jgi:hypothetical protein
MLVAAQSKTFSPTDVGRLLYRACPGIDLFGTGGLR